MSTSRLTSSLIVDKKQKRKKENGSVEKTNSNNTQVANRNQKNTIRKQLDLGGENDKSAKNTKSQRRTETKNYESENEKEN